MNDMNAHLGKLKQALQNAAKDAVQGENAVLMEVVSKIDSQINVIEGCPDKQQQLTGFQRLSHDLMVIELLMPDAHIATKRTVNDLRVHIAQLGYLTS